MSNKTTINNLLTLAYTLGNINIKEAGADVKTMYWLSKNSRLLAPIIKEFEALRNEVTTTVAFKAFQAEMQEAGEDMDKQAEIQDKYKDVIADADKELHEHASKEVDVPEYYKLSIDKIVGIPAELVPQLFDLITD